MTTKTFAISYEVETTVDLVIEFNDNLVLTPSELKEKLTNGDELSLCLITHNVYDSDDEVVGKMVDSITDYTVEHFAVIGAREIAQ